MADQENTLGKADEDDQTLGELAGSAPAEEEADAPVESGETPEEIPQSLLDRARTEGIPTEGASRELVESVLSALDRQRADSVRREWAAGKPQADTGSDDEVKLPELQGEDDLVTLESMNAYIKARDQRDTQRERRLLGQLEAARGDRTHDRLDNAIANLSAEEREIINRRPAARAQLADEFKVMVEVERRLGRQTPDGEMLRRAMPTVFGDELKAVAEKQVRQKVTDRQKQMIGRPGSTSRSTKKKDKWTKAEEKLSAVLPDDMEAYDDTLSRAL